MKIKWIGPERVIPKIGIFNNGDVREVDNQTARDLIGQGLAMRYTKPKAKKSKTKKPKE
jgi:hypothetical protein